MKRFVLFIAAFVGLVTGCQAASPSFSSFYTNHFTTNGLVIKANLNPTQFDTNSSSITITITNVSGISGGSHWTNPIGVLQPRSGQTTNALLFISASSDNATNSAFTVDTVNTWTDIDARLIQGRIQGTNLFGVSPFGTVSVGRGVGGIWYAPDESDVFAGVRDASLGESEYAALHFAAIDHQDATNYATFTKTLRSGANASGVSTFRAAIDGLISEVAMHVQPSAGVARLEVENMGDTTFSVFDNAGTFVHNMLWAVDGFAMVPSLTTNLVAGVNELETMNEGVILLTGPTTNPADTIVNLGDGNGVGNFFVLINNAQNSAFTLQDGDPLWDNPLAFQRLNGNWVSTNRGDSIWLFNNGWFITEIGRMSGNTNVSAPVVMNPTDTILPYRQSEGVFADSLLQYRDTNYMTLRGTGAGLFIGSNTEAWYGSGLTGEAIVAANIVADGDPDDLEMLITSVDGSDYGQFHVSGSSSSVTTSLAVGGASPSQLFLSTKGIYQKEGGSDFNINFDPFGLIAAPAPFYFNQDASLVNPTDPIAIIQYQTSSIFRLNRASGYTGAGTLFLSDDGTYKAAGITINPSNTFIPYRTNSTTFADSPLSVTATNNVQVAGRISFDGTSSSHPMIRRYFSTDAVVFRNGDDTGFGDAVADRLQAEDALYGQVGTSAGYGSAPVTFFVTPTTVVSPVSTETNLLHYTLAGNSLSALNARLLIRASGTFAANANNKRVRVYFGGTAIFDTTSLGFNGGSWVVNGEVIRVNNTSQVANITWNSSNTTLSSSANYATPGSTLSGSVIVAISSESDAAGDISLRTVSLTYAPEY